MNPSEPPPGDPLTGTRALLESGGYLPDGSVTVAVHLALALGRPLLLEGQPGVGKTEVAKVLARARGAELIRLQCYEGLDLAASTYEWDHARQILAIRLAEASGHAALDTHALYDERFLLRRPLLRALLPSSVPPVLLIDELDRTDDAFEAFLLEFLSDWQVSVPEYGTVRASTPPTVVITSNRTRELHDALKRRCLYCFVPYPDAARELRIVQAKVPEAPLALARQAVAFVAALRGEDLHKAPGVAETLDWVRALLALEARTLGPELARASLGALLKTQDDLEWTAARVQDLLARAQIVPG